METNIKGESLVITWSLVIMEEPGRPLLATCLGFESLCGVGGSNFLMFGLWFRLGF